MTQPIDDDSLRRLDEMKYEEKMAEDPKPSTRHRLLGELDSVLAQVERAVADPDYILPDDVPGIIKDTIKYLEKLK